MSQKYLRAASKLWKYFVKMSKKIFLIQSQPKKFGAGTLQGIFFKERRFQGKFLQGNFFKEFSLFFINNRNF
jgi:hypothetical protein